MDNKNLRLRYYAKIEDEPLFDILIQSIIKADNQLMVLYYYIWQDCTYNGKSTGAYIVFYQYGQIDHSTNFPGPVFQSGS